MSLNAEEMFYDKLDLDSMAFDQQIKPVADIEEFSGSFWPEEETQEEFLTTLKKWREGK